MPTFHPPRRLRIARGLTAALLGVVVVAVPAAPAGTAGDEAKGSSGAALSLGAWSVHGGGANVSGGGYSGTVSIGQVEMPPATVARAGALELTTGWLLREPMRTDALFSDNFEP